MRQSREGTREMSIINERPSRLAGPSLLHELVASSSDEAAIDFLEHGSRRRKMSYRALHTLSDILAQKIVDTMAKLEDASAIVPVLLPQCPELYVVLLAILKAGKAFCPIGLDTPTERLKFILGDISANLLITDYAHGSKLHLASSIITLHADQILSSTDEHIPYRSLHVRTDDLAYVLYTSGSTGAPKAVSVSHRAVTQSLLAHDRHIPNFGRFLQFAAPTFDVSIFEIFFPWYRGRTLVGRTRSLMLDDLAGTILILDVDAAELTPTVVSNLLDGRSSVPSLKLLLTIGEMLTREVIAEYGDSDERVGILWAMYGPTEAAIHCTLQPLISATASTGLIGYPLDTVSAFIAAPHSGDGLHSDLTILPIGDEGELVVGGPQIAEEYLNRPDLTSASFMHHSKYGYLYRTGDRAKICSDGTLECLGRVATGQVKLKGQRVELGEIEQIILKVEGCRAAAVLVVKEQLVAFCAIGNREISRADVRQICKQWLPEIMIPSDVVLMHSMPQLPSGKINKASLSAGYRQAPHSDNSLSADFDNDTAHPILHLLSKHLQQDLGLDSDLAPAGLDSLQAIRLASALRSGGYHLTTLQILSATTARDIIVAANAASSAGIATGIHHADDTTFADEIKVPEVERYGKRIAYTLPCTPLQEAMLAETITRPGAYCNWFEVEVFEPHSFEDIRNALQRLARGTEILRTGFCPATNSDGTFVQVVWTELEAAQIRQVREFTRSYSLGSPESLLRPLSVQASTKSGKPRLLFQLHHALYDGWSIDLILEDLGKLLRGEQLPQRPQFRDIVRYHAQRETGSHVSDKRYWTQMLRERPESSLPNFNGTIVTNSTSHSWSGRSTVSLQSLVERSRGLLVNPQVYFQAAVAYVTSAYVGSSDVVIGNVTSGRTIPVAGVEDIIGPCIASLPFRLHFDSLTKVREILSETQRLNRESLEHCSLPLREIAKAASVRAGVRLFDVLFVWQQSLQSLTNSKTSLQLVDSADELEFNVTLEYEPHPDHISFRATFDPSTIPVNQVKHFAQQIDEVVQFFLDYTDGRTSEITRGFSTASRSIANALPRQRILTHGPARAVERWAQATPEKEAVVVFCLEDGAMRIKAKATYATLNRDANRFARILQNNGVCSGDLVAVIMEKSLDLYVSILAVLKLGAGYLPLVPDLPAERTRTILHDARVAICISDSLALPELRQRTTATIVCIGNTDLSVYPGHDFDVAYDGSRVAYAVFTSGSTGTPKGVLVTQDNLMSNLEHLSTVYPYSAHSRLLQSCSQAFDVSVFEIFFSWHVGICLCTAKKDDLFIDLESAIDKMGITHLSLTPTVAALVDPDNVPRVELLVTAGEAVTEHVRRKWAGRGLYQGYGPSETTNICTIRPSVSPTDLINNIGRPFDNTSAFVLDLQSTSILPRGAVGELCFGGYQVFQGYLHQPELTAAKIVDHSTYGRIYRSGDLGVMLEDDSILFVGRMDDQVKIRGQRVELGEITSAILDQDSVHDCATFYLSHHDTSRVVNFWVPAKCFGADFAVLDLQSQRSTTLDIFASISHRLPTYMVPSLLVAVSKLPMTAQGKVDKRLLQASLERLREDNLEHTAYSQDEGGGSAITHPREIQIARLLAETLRLPAETIRRTSSFFNLGLDSVSAIRFSNDLRKASLGNFAVSTILSNSTIAQLSNINDVHPPVNHPTAGTLRSPDCVINGEEISRIRKMMDARGTPITKVLPCTPLQEAMLSSGQSSFDTSYNNVMVFSIKGDLKRLQDCWSVMVQRHEILRTAFVATNDPSYAFAQAVIKDANVQWGELGWSSESYEHANHKVMDLLRAERPPIWLAVARGAPSVKLLFCCHHAIYDGSAMQSLLQELQDVYHHRKLLPPAPYDLYLQHMLSQGSKEADDFWRTTFQDFEPTFFPDLTGRTHEGRPVSSVYHRRLKLRLSQARAACQSASVSLLSAIHATWAKLLHFYTGESDVCFGNVVGGRNLAGHDLQRLVAPCFNTLPIRVKFDFRGDNATLLQLTHRSNVETLAFHLTPLRRIQTTVLKDGGHLFDTLVILQPPSQPLDDTIWTLEEDHGKMDLPLVCEISQDEAKDELNLLLHYQSTILSNREAEIIAETFDASLESTVRYPSIPASDILGLPSILCAESNLDFARVETAGQFLHSGFEQNAYRTPDRIALDFLHVDGTRTAWSFNTLNEKANDVAHALLNANVEPEDIIPIHLLKGPSFYASILGVLKAGAAFAPVYPDLPDARKCLMLTELDAKIVITGDRALPQDFVKTAVLDVATLECARKDNPVVKNLTATNLAYCLYTSGSTGVPKAVSMEHRSPIRTVESSKNLVPWKSSSRLLQYAAVTFDMCYYDCFLAWTFGFTLCAAEQQMMLDELPRTINTLDVDLLDLTPSVAASLFRNEVPCVQWLYCIGEAMLPSIVQEWKGACVNSYGPTEAAFCTTMQPASQDTKTAVIGKPFASTSFAIFPTHGDRPLPLLSAGELYIGGAQLARGYLGRADLTNEKFVMRCGQRFYRSGDVVRMLSDGDFEFIGRADDQVKIRGLRVELDEINNVLKSSHADIQTVNTTILKKDETAKEQLVTFVVTSRGFEDYERAEFQNQLRQAAKDRLPSYMIPQFFFFVDRIPRSLAGKVDRNALSDVFRKSIEEATMPNGTTQELPAHQWRKIEQHIRSVFARLSNSSLEDVLPSSTIYQLGLDSISAVQIATALRGEGYHVHGADVMRYLTCVDIAAHIERGAAAEQPEAIRFDFRSFDTKHRPSVLELCRVSGDKVSAICPCTPLQTGMISQMLAKDGATYLNFLRLQLDSGVDLHSLKQAWGQAMITHQMLRTGFVHLEDKTFPFGMVEYTPDVNTLPWMARSKMEICETSDVWLGRFQRTATSDLHRPAWSIRIVYDENNTYLDLAIFHALFDAQSLQSIFQDVAAAYRSKSLQPQGAINAAIEIIIQHSDDPNEEGKKFWNRMGDHATPCRFPNLAPLRYKPRPPMVHTRCSTKTIFELENACRKANTTVQAAGITGWLSLLSAYTGNPTPTCGVVLSGRDSKATEKVVFPCINTVPFAHEVTASPSKMLSSVTNLIAEVRQHQHIPLNSMQRLMGHSNETLFDSIFAYQKLPSGKDEQRLWTVVEEKASIEYPVSIELERKGDQLEYRLTFMPHIVPQEQAALMLDQLDSLIQASLCLAPEPPSFETSLYSITQAQEPTLPSEARLLHELVELTVAAYPQRTAFEFAHAVHENEYFAKRWTYAELDAEGNKVANLLIAKGVEPGGLVAICFEKCPEASFAMLGILKAGCAFVAIDPGAPVARQTFIVEDSKAAAILSMAAQSNGFRRTVNVPIFDLNEVSIERLSSSKPTLARDISPQDRSYCLYTSGTTGTPKGCELTHENAVQALLSFQRLFAGHWDTNSRWLQFASFHFDVSVLEQFWSWSVGICVVSAPRDVVFEDLANSIRTLGITHIDLTPSLAQILHPDDVPSLCKGVFITGGESLKQEILDAWGPKGVIYNGYGPTEATIGCTMYPRVPANGKPSNIGRQFDNVGTYVLQPGSDVPVLRGGIGELCVAGKLVGKGYLNREELTEKSFPYLERFGERVYRTGDLVRILHDRTFEFLGRADDQVKLRGQRLEIGEINSVIRQSHRLISDVATLVLKHPRQQKEQLVAFVVNSGTKGQAEILLEKSSDLLEARDACHERLPPYMVPTHFIQLSSLPLNVNNKADVKKLKQLYEALSAKDLQKLSTISDDDGDSQQWSVLELKLRDVVTNELDTNKDSVGRDTSFFELGMDSISVIGVTRAMKRFGLPRATTSLIMTHSTLRRLAKAWRTTETATRDRSSLLVAQQAIAAAQHRHRRAVARTHSVKVADIEAVAPCTPLQQGMIARSLENDDGLYFNTFLFRLSDNIDHDRLRESWQSVYDGTQILRTVFSNTEDGYVQAVLRNVQLPWTVDSKMTDEPEIDCLVRLRQKWLQSNQSEFIRPFELVAARTPRQSLLVLHIFHGLYDGISIELTFEAVWNAYTRHDGGHDVPSFQSALAHGPLRSREGARTFWREHLLHTSARSLPSSTAKHSSSAIQVTRALDVSTAFEPTRRELNVTAQAMIQSCWVSVLQDFAKGAVTMGVVVSGRSIDLEGADRIVGPMFNTIPFRHRSNKSETWESIIKRVHRFNIAAHPYQHTPLRDVMKWIDHNPGQPLFDNLFVYQIGQSGEEWTKNDAWELVQGGVAADYPLAFELEQNPDNIWTATLVAQDSIADAATLDRLLDSFEGALREAVDDPGKLLQTSIEMDEAKDDGSEVDRHATSNSNATGNFVWTNDANILREAFASQTNSELGEISESTSIFELGLDSIDVIKLSSKLRNRGVHLPVSEIMRGRTIASMLPRIERITDIHTDHSFTDIELAARNHELKNYLSRQGMDMTQVEDALPLTPLQEAMIAEMITSDFARYYNFDVMKLDSGTSIEQLRAAWTQVVAASPILRTSFVAVDDPEVDASFVQVVQREPHDFWQQCTVESDPDFSTLFEELRKKANASTTLKPPFQVLLVQTSDRAHLVLSIAHALYDGSSLHLIHADVKRAYGGRLEPRPSYHPALHDILSTSGADAANYWADYLFAAKPTVFARRKDDSGSRADVVHRLQHESEVAIADLVDFAKRSHVSLQTLGQAVFTILLASYARSLDVTFGSVLSGRDDETTSELLFPMMNTVLVRTILHGTRSELLHHIQDSFMNTKQWQHFPLRKCLALAEARGGLFESLFIYQKSVETSDEHEDALYTSVEGHSDVEYPVCVEMQVMSGKLVWRCAVKDEVFDRAGSGEMMLSLDKILRGLLASPGEPVMDFTDQGISLCGLPPFQDERVEKDSTVPSHEPHRGNSPQPQTVLAIREILTAVSGTPEDEITDDMNIFHIGLDSISAIKVSALLRQRDIILSVGEMLRAGTIIEMARIADARLPRPLEKEEDYKSIIEEAMQHLNLKDAKKRAVPEHRIGKVRDEVQMLPATAGQLYMLSLWLNTNGSHFYPEFTYTLTGAISFVKLQDAWQGVVAAESILRTTFIGTQDPSIPYVQLIRTKADGNIVNGTSLVKNEATGMIQPWAYLHVTRTDSGWRLALKIHHALYDGVSLPLIMHRLQDLCNGGAHLVPEPSFAKVIAGVVTPSAVEARKLFWTNYLSGVEQHHIAQPTSSPKATTEVFAPQQISTRALDECARRNGVSVQALFLATYAKIYARLTSTPEDIDVVIGIYLANRSLPFTGIEKAAIPMVNLLPLRVHMPAKQNTVVVARQIQQDLQKIGELTNASASLWEISEWTGVKIDTFVNFLTLPNTGKAEEREGDVGVAIIAESQWESPVSRVVEHATRFSAPFEQQQPESLKNAKVNKVYLHAVDIEATVRNGALDVGVFAPVEMLELEAANILLEDLKVELARLSE